jgi:curved DNA-binding protein CbpA
LETPIDLIVAGLKNKKPEEARKYYLKIAKLLHPDKNCHPKAKEAFQNV